jgi:hypothetical protein
MNLAYGVPNVSAAVRRYADPAEAAVRSTRRIKYEGYDMCDPGGLIVCGGDFSPTQATEIVQP